MELIEQIRTNNEKHAKEAVETSKHNDLVQMQLQTQQVIVQSVSSLVDYLQGRVSKTEVVNQLEEIGTPDVRYVVDALNDLHATLKTHENTDLSEITSVMKGVLEEAKKIPKTFPEQKEQKFVDYTAKLIELSKSIQLVEKAVKAQKTTVEAPVVNVPAPVVNVDAPDLEPLRQEISTLLGATKANKLPIENDSVKVHNTNNLISVKFNEYKITYDSFDDSDEPRIERVDYFLAKKKVATLTCGYNQAGNLTGVKVNEVKS